MRDEHKRHLMAVLALTVGLYLSVVEAQVTEDGPLEAVLRRASAYVDTYKRDLGSVIADEHYVQRVNVPDLSNYASGITGHSATRHVGSNRSSCCSSSPETISPGSRSGTSSR